MKACKRKEEVLQAVRAGHWPQGCTEELRVHVAECGRCAEDVKLLSAFAAAREGTMRMAQPQSAELLWWKAQLRRRHVAMERLERPGLAAFTATMAASVVVLVVVIALVWKSVDWSQLLASASQTDWNGWLVGSVAAVLCGFVVVAVMVGLGWAEERG